MDGFINDYYVEGINNENSENFGSRIRESINSRLQTAWETNCQCIPYRLFKSLILKNFGTDQIVLFQFGQKAEMNLVCDSLENLKQHFLIDVAIGCEMKTLNGDEFLSGSLIEGYEKFSYSVMSSRIACNILIKKSNNVDNIIEGAHRLCVYNSIQHSRSGHKNSLSLTVDEEIEGFSESNPYKFNTRLFKSIFKNVEEIEGLMIRGLATGTKLRYEIYCNINNRTMGKSYRFFCIALGIAF